MTKDYRNEYKYRFYELYKLRKQFHNHPELLHKIEIDFYENSMHIVNSIFTYFEEEYHPDIFKEIVENPIVNSRIFIELVRKYPNIVRTTIFSKIGENPNIFNPDTLYGFQYNDLQDENHNSTYHMIRFQGRTFRVSLDFINYLTINPSLSLSYMRRHLYIPWSIETVCMNPNITMEMIKVYPQPFNNGLYWYYENIGFNENITIEFLRENYDRIARVLNIRCFYQNPNFTEEMYEFLKEKVGISPDLNKSYVETYCNFMEKDGKRAIEVYKEEPRKYSLLDLCRNPVITWANIMNNPVLNWNYSNISLNPNIEKENIESTIDKGWSTFYLLGNENLKIEYILELIERYKEENTCISLSSISLSSISLSSISLSSMHLNMISCVYRICDNRNYKNRKEIVQKRVSKYYRDTFKQLFHCYHINDDIYRDMMSYII
jgi:hypothetical protein